MLEFTDPGLSRTGGREMAIKRADLALLFYSALSLSSLHHLQTLKEDLEMKIHMPLRLVCDIDEVIEDEEDGGSTGISSVSEGYESDTDRDSRIRRHNSMEKFRKTNEEGGIAIEQGQKWANELGSECEFIVLSSSQFTDANTFLENIINSIHKYRKRNMRTFLKHLKSRSKSSTQKLDKTRDSRESTKSSISSSYSDIENKSKVCTIM
ncbi:hypothetical protein DICVIV_12425 [Dictyocaulus viviparus]|uniref:Ras family protein n=1 Tax=Dictyocaulus viviparus TaxID=29172 RepID=A0A0D8XAH0_DICVI|nr:hypothetical protein DICVIV_12425 [Dictyocaulus viviparus]